MTSNPFSDFQPGSFFSEFGSDFFNYPVGSASDMQSSFSDLLEDSPDIAFQGALQRGNLTPNLSQQFRGQRENLYNQFQGLLDQQIRQGFAPDLRFGDFIGNFDFGREAFRTPPSQRPGGGTGQFAPPTTFLR